MSTKVDSVSALKEIALKLEENSAKQDELAEQATALVEERAELWEQLERLKAAEGESNGEVLPAKQQRPSTPPPKGRGRPPGKSTNKAAKPAGGGKRVNPTALHNMIRDQLVAEQMPDGISFGEIVRGVQRWINSGKYKSISADTTNIVSQALNKLKREGHIHQPGGLKTNYMLAGHR